MTLRTGQTGAAVPMLDATQQVWTANGGVATDLGVATLINCAVIG